MSRDEHNDRTVIERVDPLVGSVLGAYRIDFRLAAGGFGAIYRATHVTTHQQVALKVLHTELATSDARVIARFRREGAMLMQLRDEHTVTAIELGDNADGPLFIAMELLHGESLYEQFRSRGALPWQRMVGIGLQICSSLAEAHALGIVHRDLKPANINLEKRGGNSDFVKVLDFGIAKAVQGDEVGELTQAGQMIGTFDYMAPEQMVGGQCTARTDIYTLGVMMYEMIAGRRPFADAQSPTAMLASLLTLTPSPISAFADVPAELDRIVLKCLEREPQNRYQSVAELVHDLEGLIATDEGVTRLVHTPSPVLTSEEVTVIAQNRPKRDSAHPHLIPRGEGSSPAIPVPDRLESPQPPPRSRRETPGSNANVIRRDSIAALPPEPAAEPRAKRDSSQPVIKRRDPSQPPFEPKTIALQPPMPDNRGSQPAIRIAPQPRPPSPPPVYTSPAPGTIDPRYPQPQAPYAQPYPPQPPYPPQLEGSGWDQARPSMYPTPARGGYELSAHREVVVRRIVWAIAIALGVILAIVVTSQL